MNQVKDIKKTSVNRWMPSAAALGTACSPCYSHWSQDQAMRWTFCGFLTASSKRKTLDSKRPFWGCPGFTGYELCSWDSTKTPVLGGAASQDPASLALVNWMKHIYIVPREEVRVPLGLPSDTGLVEGASCQ